MADNWSSSQRPILRPYKEDVTVSMSTKTAEEIGTILLAAADAGLPFAKDAFEKKYLQTIGRHIWETRGGEHIYLAGREQAKRDPEFGV